MKYIKREDLIIGEIYRYEGPGHNIFMWGGYDATFSTHENRNIFSILGGNFGNNAVEADDFEKAWLGEMIKKNKFIKEKDFKQAYKNTLTYEIY